MKAFLRKILLYIFLPAMFWIIAEGLLPVTFFTHRHWEALKFITKVPHKFQMYPNISSSMNAVGDLCHHTEYAVIKKEVWKTDKLGFRNNEFVKDPDVLFIGDSFLGGSSLSQDEILTNKVKAKLGSATKIYNMAPSNFSEFDKCLKLGLISKPKLIIFSMVERSVPDTIEFYHDKNRSKLTNLIKNSLDETNLNVYIDKVCKLYSIEWIKARLYDSKGKGVKSIGNSNMFFLKESEYAHKKDDFSKTIATFISYKKYCDSLGIKFIFLPMPNKETVYYEIVPYEKQPDFLFTVDSALNSNNIATINTLKIYNDYRKTSDKLLYHLDDTHWNPTATSLIADQVVKVINNTLK